MRKKLLGLAIVALFPAALSAQKNMNPERWTIGALEGPSIFELSTPEGFTNPVFTSGQVNDFKVDIVSHPFIIKEASKYYMFFTSKDKSTNTGGIGVAESDDGFVWKYRNMAISEPFIVSHPFIFKWKNEIYMTPETNTESSVKLYRAVNFPDQWILEAVLLEGDSFISPTLFRYNKTWWLYTSPQGNESLRLFYADNLKGPWTEHPQSPVVEKNRNIARPAGRPLVVNGRLYRMGMDCDPVYGNQVYALEVRVITRDSYVESLIETPLIRASSQGWNSKAMHHLDAIKTGKKRWIAIVDALGN